MRSGGTGILGTWYVDCREDGVRLSPLLVCAGARLVGSISPSATTLNKAESFKLSTVVETDIGRGTDDAFKVEGSGIVMGLDLDGICGTFDRPTSSLAPAPDCYGNLLAIFVSGNLIRYRI